MKKLVCFVCLFCLVAVSAFAQSMTDSEVVKYAVQERKAGASEQDIATRLIQKGATTDQIQNLRQKYSKQLAKAGMSTSADNTAGAAAARMRRNNEDLEYESTTFEPDGFEGVTTPRGKRVFGRDIFNNKKLTFEPVMNIATPQNYVLGPGDQLVIDVYGASQESMTLVVSPDGDITVPNYGPIHVSGLTVASAQSRISSKLGDYFASSEIKTTLGQTRTILVNVMGEVKAPGTYSLNAFATVFHALYRAGGISSLGTLRNIKVYRQGKLISVVDVYEFILNGRLAGNVRLQDNDVIQVGPYECIVDIEGRVKRPMAYEMRKTESVQTLLRYCGGFSSDAYTKSLRVFRKSGHMKNVYNIEEFDWSDFKVDDGDVISVDTIIDRYENMVEVKGAVFRPGMFRFGEKINSVRSLIEAADGLREEAMAERVVMRRLKPNRTQEVISVNLQAILDGTQPDIPLQNEDVLFVPTQLEHQNLRTVQVVGEVIFPGMFEYGDNMTVEDAILQAGGLTYAASTAKIDVSRRLYDPAATESGMQIAKTFSFSMKDNYLVEGDRDFHLEPYDVVQVRRSPVFQQPMQVSVDGEVAFRGKYTLETKNQRLSDIVKAAGGIMPGAYVRGARLVRRMNEAELARRDAIIRLARQSASDEDSLNLNQLAQDSTYSVGIHLDEALSNPGSTNDIELQEGDRLVVPRFNHTVKISGNVLAPNTVAFEEGKNYKYYVEQAGGFGDRSRKRHTYIVYQNGTMAMGKKAKIEPGCEVIVPKKAPRDTGEVSQWLSIGTSAASLATMFATVANLIK